MSHIHLQYSPSHRVPSGRMLPALLLNRHLVLLQRSYFRLRYFLFLLPDISPGSYAITGFNSSNTSNGHLPASIAFCAFCTSFARPTYAGSFLESANSASPSGLELIRRCLSRWNQLICCCNRIMNLGYNFQYQILRKC